MSASDAILSYVSKGDISALSSEQRAWLYTELCRRYGFDPLIRPFDVLELNGKVVLYANRGATDSIALRYGITRTVTVKPCVRTIGGLDIVYCEASAEYQGRIETATATVPLKDPATVFMKAETKAKRRATLAVIGLGLLDESEVADIPRVQLPTREPLSLPEAMTQLELHARLCLADSRIVGPKEQRVPSAWAHQVTEYAKAVGKDTKEAAQELIAAIARERAK